MKALITFLPLAAALAACQAPRIDTLSYGSQLDRVRLAAPSDPDAASPQGQERAQAVTALRAQAQALRERMAQESDRVQRIAILQQLEEIGDSVRRLGAGGPLTFEPQPVPDGAGSS